MGGCLGRNGAIVALVLGVPTILAAPALASTVPASAALASTDDGGVSYCLSAPHREEVVAVAAVLGSVDEGDTPGTVRRVPGGVDLSLEAWRAVDGVAFDRACAAVAPAATAAPGTAATSGTDSGAGASSDWWRSASGWFALTGVVIGAVLSSLFTSGREARARRRTQAAALRAAVREFHLAVSVYVEVRRERRVEQQFSAERDIHSSRSALLTQLAQAAVERRNTEYAQRLSGELDSRPDSGGQSTSRPLGVPLTAEWAPDEAAAKATKVEKALNHLVDDVMTLALAVEQPFRHRLKRT